MPRTTAPDMGAAVGVTDVSGEAVRVAVGVRVVCAEAAGDGVTSVTLRTRFAP